MDGIILINKDKDYTSRDIVNIISKHFHIKKVGHFGTLDPLATGLLIIGIGKYTKFQKILDKEIKEYEVETYIGKSTDTYDITGNTIKEEVFDSTKEEFIKNNLLSFKKRYLQEVPIYSAIKIKGEKLYNYARNKENIILPKKEIEIFSIINIKFNKNILSFTCKVSKGCYIRSLINDLSNICSIPMCMNNLKRIKIDNFLLQEAYSIKDIIDDNYKFYDISKLFTEIKKIEIDDDLYKKVINGSLIDNIYNEQRIIFIKNNKFIAFYRVNFNNKLEKIFFF